MSILTKLKTVVAALTTLEQCKFDKFKPIWNLWYGITYGMVLYESLTAVSRSEGSITCPDARQGRKRKGKQRLPVNFYDVNTSFPT